MIYTKAILIATTIFLIFFEGIAFVKFQPKDMGNTSNVTQKENTIEIKDSLDIERQVIECLKNYTLNDDCNTLKKNNIVTNENILVLEEYTFFSDLESSHIFIKIIYIFLIFSLALQFYLYFISKEGYLLKEREFHLSELAINASPMLGLLGTFFSIAILLEKNDAGLSLTLISGFFDAIMSTIIGIIFYLINFYLKVIIYPKIDFND